MEISSELLKKLSQIGYMACMKGYVKEGGIIMDGVNGVRPDHPPILIGVAIARITAAQYQEAVDILKLKVLNQDPSNLTAKCFLGIALFELGDKKQAQLYFTEIMAKGDANHQAIAESYNQKM